MQPENSTVAVPASSIVYLTRNYANYNHWANMTLVNWLRTKPADVLSREVPSSFPTIAQTLQHMWQTQRYWLGVLRKEENPHAEPFNGTPAEVLDGIVAHSEEMAAYINGLTEDFVSAPLKVTNPWFECNFPSFDYVVQVMNHSTYHRGQVVTIGRNLGLTDAPMTDYNYYNVYGK